MRETEEKLKDIKGVKRGEVARLVREDRDSN